MMLNMRRRIFDFLFTAAACLIFLALFRQAASPAPFTYDEADYMVSTRIGMGANYLDTNAMSLPQFIDAGLKALHKKLNRASLSESVRRHRDPEFFRHYHGPLNSYWLLAVARLGGSGERWMRSSNLLFHVATFLTVYFGVLWVFGSQFRIAAVAASSCYLFCVNNILSIAALSSHAPFLLLSILTLFAIAKFAAEPGRKRFYWALGLCAVSICALEYAVLLFFVLGVVVLAARKKFFSGWSGQEYWRFARNAALLIFGVLFVLWPSSILKLTIVQGFAFTVFFARLGSYSPASPLDVWKMRFVEIPMDMAALCLSIAVCATLVWRSPWRRQLLPFLLYGLLVGLITLKNTKDDPRYISSMFAPFYVSAAVLLAWGARRVPALLQASAAAILCGVMFFTAYGQVAAQATAPYVVDEAESLIALMRSHSSASVLVPADYLPPLQYYFPNAMVRSYPPGTPPASILGAAAGFDGACLDASGNPLAESDAPTGETAIPVGRLTCYFKR